MATLYDVPAEALIEAIAEDLSDRLERPDWATFVKTGPGRELAPKQDDFWETRAASLLRKVAIEEPIGVDRLSTEYGSAKAGTNRYRVAPRRRSDASEKIIRTILQQLEEEGLVESAEGRGRVITSEGRSLLDTTADEVLEELDRPELERYA